jgi:hypothetical protein
MVCLTLKVETTRSRRFPLSPSFKWKEWFQVERRHYLLAGTSSQHYHPHRNGFAHSDERHHASSPTPTSLSVPTSTAPE